MFCPKCRAEYRSGFSACGDCGINLVAELPSAHHAIPEITGGGAAGSPGSSDTLVSLSAELEKIFWFDAEFLFLRQDNETLVLEIKQSNGDSVRVIFLDQIAVQHIGHWGMNMIKGATITDRSPLIDSSLATIKNHYGDDVNENEADSGDAEAGEVQSSTFSDPWFCFQMIFSDDCELQIVFQTMEIEN